MPSEVMVFDRNKKLLTFEEFLKDRDNFHLHFVGEPGEHRTGDIYRSQLPYVRCRLANWGDFNRLAQRIRVALEYNRPYLHDLYEMYLMMYPYAECNRDMFA